MKDNKGAEPKKSEESGNPPQAPQTTPAKRDIGGMEERFSVIITAKSAFLRPPHPKRVKRTNIDLY
jgi:hypothetical protein